MEELSYTSKFDGETTDNILDNAKAIMEQTTAEDGETVQVYDTSGVPHKIAKTELLKKSTLALPSLSDISSFVAVNSAGNAIGLMTKEQVASVLAELIPVVTETMKGLVEANGFRNIGQMAQSEGLDNIKNGYGYNYGVSDGTGFSGMFISVAPMSNYRIQIKISSAADNLVFRAMGNNTWFSWKKVTFTNL